MSQLKPSIQSVEGSSLMGLAASIIGLLYKLIQALGIEQAQTIPVDLILKKAETVKEIVDLYAIQAQQSGGFNIHDGFTLSSIIALLVFLYKVYDKFLVSRTVLKSQAMEDLK